MRGVCVLIDSRRVYKGGRKENRDVYWGIDESFLNESYIFFINFFWDFKVFFKILVLRN